MDNDLDPTRAKWRQIADRLISEIEDGTFPVDSKVPTVLEIVAKYGVAVATAQKALAAVRKEGWTRTERGLGSFVLPRE